MKMKTLSFSFRWFCCFNLLKDPFLSFWAPESFERCIFYLATAQCLSSTEPKLEWRVTHSEHLPTSHLIALCVLGSDRTSSPATVLHNHLYCIIIHMATVLSGPLQPPANNHTGELASLAVTSQVDGIRGLIIQLPLAALCSLRLVHLCIKTSPLQWSPIQLWQCYTAIFRVYWKSVYHHKEKHPNKRGKMCHWAALNLFPLTCFEPLWLKNVFCYKIRLFPAFRKGSGIVCRPEGNSTRSLWRGQSSIQTAAAPDTQAYGHTLCNLKHTYTHTSVKVHFLLHLGSANFNHLSLSVSLWCSLHSVLVYSCAFSHATHSQLYTDTQTLQNSLWNWAGNAYFVSVCSIIWGN